jgi:DNA-binding CsgD family transcriptional regulator
MKGLADFFRHNLKSQDKLGKFSQILQRNFGIDDFSHLTLYENGQFANISTHYDQWCYMWEHEHPKDMNFLIAPSRLRSSSFQLAYDTNFVDLADSLPNRFPQHHPFIIVRKEGNDKAHIFGFAARKHTPHLPSFYLNNHMILHSFVDYYLESEIKHKDEDMIDMASLRGHNRFYNSGYGNESLIDLERHSNFFKEIGIDPALLVAAQQLSPREKQVLLGLSKGQSARQTGRELHLSHRTVEFYQENVKNKLGALSREELIRCTKILQMAGFF